MATEMEIQTALANLEAGKFSFRMVDAIKDRIATLESELSSVSVLHADAVKDLRQREFTISRLEAELRKANASVHALLKANALTELTVRETKRGAVMIRDYVPVAREHTVALSKKTIAFLSSVDLKAEFEKLKVNPQAQKALAWLAALDLTAEWNKLKAHPLTEKALRELQSLFAKAQAVAKQYAPGAQKQISALVEKVSAYIAQLNKKAA